MSLTDELKRRKVFKVGAAYLVVAWLAVQAASIGFPAFDAPLWALRIFILVALLGFPVTLVLAWVFESTPEGVRLDGSTAGNKRILAAAAALVLLALGWYFLGQPAFRKDETGSASLSTARDGSPVSGHATEKVVDAVPIPAKSIAVLPFNDMSPEHDQEYFSDGMAEEILNALAQVQDLKVAGRTSSFFFKGKNEKLPAIGAALGVANVLEGSVRKQGSKVRITAQLIRADNGFHLWSQTYDGDLTDVFELQEHIARAITDALKVVLEGDQKTRLAQLTTQNVEAYQQYLRGIYFFNRRGYRNLQDSIAAFKAALALDPAYVDAWAGLAQTLAIFDNYAEVESDRRERGKTDVEAIAAADRALQLQPELVSALVGRAYARTRLFDWLGAEADYRAAVALNPRDVAARLWYGQFFMHQRRWREAAEQMDQAVALDPLSPIVHYSRGWLQDSQGDFAGALPHHDEALRLEPGLYIALVNKLEDLVDLGRYEAAIATAQDMPEPRRATFLSVIAALQNPSRVNDAIKQLISYPLGGTDQPWAFAKLGKYDLALAELERQFREHDSYRMMLCLVPAFKPFYSDPRFQALLRQMKLPESAPGKAPANP